MGKLLVILGLKIQSIWDSMQCRWNKWMLALMFKVDSCPNKICTCKEK